MGIKVVRTSRMKRRFSHYSFLNGLMPGGTLHRRVTSAQPSVILENSDQTAKEHSSYTAKTTTRSGNSQPTMSSILPRTHGYKRVDSDTGSGRMRFGWKKFAFGAALIIGLVWVFGPRERREQVIEGIKRPTWARPYIGGAAAETPSPPEGPVAGPTAHVTTTLAEHAGAAPVKKPTSPHSPEEDPDPTKSVHCKKSHNPELPLVQYALMVDAGSTGSRIHIYKFNNCGASAEYEYEVFKQTMPGLSSYHADPQRAALSLDILFDEAVKVVPRSLHSCTPVAVKATAGLRLLGQDQSQAILDAVRSRLQDKYPFPIVPENGVEIMDGTDEGVYAWITANYLLDTVRASSAKGATSYAVLDLGGASTQIVFEPSFKGHAKLEPGDHKYELTFGGKTRTLYQHSYLGFGLMQSRLNVHRLVEFMWNFNLRPKPTDGYVSILEEIANPCLAQGTRRVVQITPAKPGELARNVTMVGNNVGSFEGCNRMVQLVMAKDAVCKLEPCSFDGVYQPPLKETFPKGKVLLLSYFYDRIAPFYEDSLQRQSLTVESVATLAKEVCKGASAWSSRWHGNTALLRELADRPEWCLDLTYIHALLGLGYEFKEDRTVRIEKQIDGTELGWALGATIAIVGADLSCKF